jgi:hypothetical protein
MPQQLKSPPAAVFEPATDASGYNRPTQAHPLADEPQVGHRSPLVDALMEQLRQARARRQTPH